MEALPKTVHCFYFALRSKKAFGLDSVALSAEAAIDRTAETAGMRFTTHKLGEIPRQSAQFTSSFQSLHLRSDSVHKYS